MLKQSRSWHKFLVNRLASFHFVGKLVSGSVEYFLLFSFCQNSLRTFFRPVFPPFSARWQLLLDGCCIGDRFYRPGILVCKQIPILSGKQPEKIVKVRR